MNHRALILSALLAGCRPEVGPAPKPLIPDPSPSAAAAACARLAELGCPEARPLSDGRPCEEIMQTAAADGLISPSCIARVRDRAGLAACRVRCRE